MQRFHWFSIDRRPSGDRLKVFYGWITFYIYSIDWQPSWGNMGGVEGLLDTLRQWTAFLMSIWKSFYGWKIFEQYSTLKASLNTSIKIGVIWGLLCIKCLSEFLLFYQRFFTQKYAYIFHSWIQFGKKKRNAFPFFANAEKKKSPTHQSTMTELLGTKIHQIFQMP